MNTDNEDGALIQVNIGVGGKQSKFLRPLAIFLAMAWFVVAPAYSADQDWQQWSVFFGNYDLNERWSTSMQVENRTSDNMKHFHELILKPAVYYRFTDTLKLGVGYKYQKKHAESNEQDVWQELFYTPESDNPFSWEHQVRLEERDIKNIGGTILRLRYLLHVTHPIGKTDKKYLVAQEAVRFNLNGKGVGPVSGFEQSRFYFGLGFKTTPKLNIEVGYLWQYERQRIGASDSNHVLRLQFLYQ